MEYRFNEQNTIQETPSDGVSLFSNPGTEEESFTFWSADRNLQEQRTSYPSELEMVHYKRGMGVILPIFSLPSHYGIGTFGKEAYRFCDFLRDAGIRYWQILPLGPTSYGDSPYQSFSGIAGNPYFIDLDFLCADGLLEIEELDAIPFGEEKEYITYSLLYNQRYRLLRRAFARAMGEQERVTNEQEDSVGYSRLEGDYGSPETLSAFREENQEWIEDYSLFQALKAEHFDVQWTEWQEEYRDRNEDALSAFREAHEKDILFQVFMQYHFFRQWRALQNYAHEAGISFIGDLPIYVAHDSADVWANRDQFYLDDKGYPTVVAGAPPDAFTADGQRWGNPIYRWDRMAERKYDFWVARFRANLRLYDILRLDHFIGFAHYWTVPAQEETARNGHWEPGPGMDLFETLQNELGALPVLVEDLGVLSDEVISLREKTGFPGMKPMQFAFGGCADSDYLPHRFPQRTSIYTGTHDSEPLRAWWENLDAHIQYLVGSYFALHQSEGVHWGLLRAAASTVADLCIFQMQDVLWTDARTRTNLPGTIGGNWKWRLPAEYADKSIIQKIRALKNLYGR